MPDRPLVILGGAADVDNRNRRSTSIRQNGLRYAVVNKNSLRRPTLRKTWFPWTSAFSQRTGVYAISFDMCRNGRNARISHRYPSFRSVDGQNFICPPYQIPRYRTPLNLEIYTAKSILEHSVVHASLSFPKIRIRDGWFADPFAVEFCAIAIYLVNFTFPGVRTDW